MINTQLTKKQIEILLLLYKFRFLHTHQFQNLLNHKKPNRIKSWLKDLTEKEYIKRDYTLKTMNKKPAIYALTIKAREFLKTRKECEISILNKIYREKTRSKTFIDHSLLIGDIYLLLKPQVSNNKTVHFATKNNLINYDYFPQPLPDAYIAIKSQNNTKRYFLEVLDEYLPRFSLRGKIQRYLDYSQSEIWEDHTNEPLPSIIIICSTETIKKFLKRFITSLLADNQAEVFFSIATQEEIITNGVINKKYAILPLG